MEFVDLKAQYRAYRREIDAAIQAVLANASFIMGPDVKALEEELAEFVGVRYAIGCASGTDALFLPLLALGIGPGDEVIVPDFTFIATAEVVVLAGGTPVFADIDPATFNLDPVSVRSRVTSHTKGIIPVSLFGVCANFPELQAVADEHGLWLIEDGAQSFGAEQFGRRSCSFGRVATTSFFPAKPLGGYGDGGAVFTNDDELADKVRVILNHGQVKRYHHARIGMNARLDTIQAAILRVKLRHFPDELEARDKVAAMYEERLHNVCVTPKVPVAHRSAWSQYTVRIPNRDRVRETLTGRGIPTAVHYPVPLSRQGAFASLPAYPCPHAEQAASEVLSLPMHPFLTEKEMDQVCGALREAL